MSDLGLAEKYLGRTLRPWWGQSPIKMIVRGLLQGAALGVAAYVALGVSAGSLDVGDLDASTIDTIERVALVVGVLALVGVAWNVVRLMVALADLGTRHTVEGTVLSCRERRHGDVLPGFVQQLVWSRGRDGAAHDRRRVRTQLVLATPDGPQAWTLHRAARHGLSQGQPVRLRATRLLGHVSRVD